jgi:hypothetical protein
LLRQNVDEPYSDLLAAKIEATGLSDGFSKALPRNLAVLLKNINI